MLLHICLPRGLCSELGNQRARSILQQQHAVDLLLQYRARHGIVRHQPQRSTRSLLPLSSIALWRMAYNACCTRRGAPPLRPPHHQPLAAHLLSNVICPPSSLANVMSPARAQAGSIRHITHGPLCGCHTK